MVRLTSGFLYQVCSQNILTSAETKIFLHDGDVPQICKTCKVSTGAIVMIPPVGSVLEIKFWKNTCFREKQCGWRIFFRILNFGFVPKILRVKLLHDIQIVCRYNSLSFKVRAAFYSSFEPAWRVEWPALTSDFDPVTWSRVIDQKSIIAIQNQASQPGLSLSPALNL